MDRQGILLGIGNPLLDMIVNVEDDFLQKHDVQLNTSSIAEERHLRLFPQLLIDYDPEFVAAGSTQNTIRVAQWMLGIPGLTSYIGCIGKDEFGERLKHHISLDGVNVNYMEHESEATGTCAMLITPTGERSMIANLAATNQFSPLFLREKKSVAFLKAAQYIYIAGFFMTVLIHFFSSCKQHSFFFFSEDAPSLNFIKIYSFENFSIIRICARCIGY